MISLTSPVRTRAEAWPAGAKLAGLCVATVALFLLESIAAQLAVSLLLLVIYRLPGRLFLLTGLRHLRVLLVFVVIVLLWHLVTRDLAAGVLIVLRMINAVALANLVTMTTRLDAMIEVIRWLLTPLRRAGMSTRPAELAFPLLIRFIPVLHGRYLALRESWRARSRKRPGWRVVLPLMLMAIDDADRVAEALRARGGVLPPAKR